MSPLPCRLEHGNTVVVDNNLRISCHRTDQTADPSMVDILEDQGAYSLCTPPAQHFSVIPTTATRRGLYVQMRRITIKKCAPNID